MQPGSKLTPRAQGIHCARCYAANFAPDCPVCANKITGGVFSIKGKPEAYRPTACREDRKKKEDKANQGRGQGGVGGSRPASTGTRENGRDAAGGTEAGEAGEAGAGGTTDGGDSQDAAPSRTAVSTSWSATPLRTSATRSSRA